MWNLRNETDEQRGKKRKKQNKPRNRFFPIEYKLMVTRRKVGEGMDKKGNGS